MENKNDPGDISAGADGSGADWTNRMAVATYNLI